MSDFQRGMAFGIWIGGGLIIAMLFLMGELEGLL